MLNTVLVSKSDLLSKLKSNRDNHAQEFKLSQQGYEASLLRRLQKMVSLMEKHQVPKLTFGDLPVPEDHTEDYDNAIAMLEMSTEQEIELTQRNFQEFVLDKWGWKQLHTSNVGIYTNFETKGN
jgi:hypothetical protein